MTMQRMSTAPGFHCEVLLTEAFTKPVSNTTRHHQGITVMDVTKCLKLGNTLHAQAPKKGKDG
jgi:hypothetical protein